MKRNIFKNTLYGMCMLLFATSCGDEFLEVEPSTSVSVDAGLTTPAQIDAFMTGMYNQTSYYYYKNHLIMGMDVKGGDVFVKSAGNYNRYPTEYQFTETPTSSYVAREIWPEAYQLIANANQIIQNVPNVELADELKNAYIAEARALRAMAHFDLVQLYAQPYSLEPQAHGVPYVDEPVNPNEEGPARDDVQTVYNKIIEDLEFAEQNIDAAASSRDRVTLPAIKGMLARVHLNMENWEQAKTYAAAAREGFELMSREDWLNGFADPTSEWMWYIGHTQDDNNGYLSVFSFYDWSIIGYSSFLLDKDFIEAMPEEDIRGLTSMLGFSGTNGAYVTKKFKNRSEWDMSQLLMRASEMVLIEAEAAAELNNDTEAQNLLYLIQLRANPDAEKSTAVGDALLEEIYLERRRELYGEGFKYLDLQRRGEDLVRNESGGHWVTGVKPVTSTDRIMPIPQDERDANPNIVQNPGYVQ